MGVRGLKSYLEREKEIHEINIGNEIRKWKQKNPDIQPIIVIDFLCLTNSMTCEQMDNICGGRQQIQLKKWTRLLDAFKAADCDLVFFCDLNVQEDKIGEWIDRRNSEFQSYRALYDSIQAGKSLRQIVEENEEKGENRSSTAGFYGMAVIAQQYGEFFFSTKKEADFEVVHYANHHNAMAVLSDDTDFMIFEGPWQFWSGQGLQINRSNQLKTTRYNRHALAQKLSLSSQQLPLFATLMGNDFTKPYFNQLSNFHRHLGSPKARIYHIARYIRKINTNSDESLRPIVHIMCGYGDIDMERLLKSSINSYNTDFSPTTKNDSIEAKLLMNPSMYRSYMANSGSVHGFTMPFYDFRGHASLNTSLPNLLIEWIRRRRGIVCTKGTFKLLGQRSFYEKCEVQTETVIRPELSLPPLDDLYSESNDSDMNDMRWNIFGWIMSFESTELAAIKLLPKAFLLISTTLYVLVKNRLIPVEVADGILYTEYAAYENQMMDTDHPAVVIAGHIRGAHVYNNAFSAMRHNFAISGLLPFIQEILQFDGVYFQSLMRKLILMGETTRSVFLEPIQNYRIYANVQ